jgi:hypothetical protein
MAKKKDLVVHDADAEVVIEWMCSAWRKYRDGMSASAFWATWERFFFDKLVAEDVEVTKVIVEAAERGQPVADQALRKYIEYMSERGKQGDMLPRVGLYIGVTARRGPIPYPVTGHPAVTFAKRNGWVIAVLCIASVKTGLPITRNAATNAPSCAYYLAEALRRLAKEGADPLTEARINKIFFKRHTMAALFEASLAG